MLLPPRALRAIRLIALIALPLLVVPPLAGASPASATAAWAGATTEARWRWPLAAPHPVVRPFAAPATAYSAGHRGIDIVAASGGLVYAPDDGIVHFAGVVVDRPVLSIKHAAGLVSSFEAVTTSLRAGDPVRRGDVVATIVAGGSAADSASGGHCSGQCLHFGVRRYGDYVSPLNYLGGIPSSVLLPTRIVPG